MEDFFDLREFIITILRRWRLIVVLVLVVGMLGASYKLIPALIFRTGIETLTQEEMSLKQQEFLEQEEAYLLERELSSAKIVNLEKDLEITQQYVEDSQLLKIDEDDCYFLTKTYYIAAGETNTPEIRNSVSSQMLQLYLTLLNDVEFYNMLSQTYGENVTPAVIKELVTIKDNGGNMLRMDIVGSSEQSCRILLDAAQSYFLSQSSVVERLIGEHTVQIVTESINKSYNAAIRKLRVDNNDKITGLEASLKAEKKNLEALLKVDPPVSPSFSPVISKKSVLKFGLIGSVVGGGLAVLWIFFMDAMDVRIKNTEEICKKYKLKCFADFSQRGVKR